MRLVHFVLAVANLLLVNCLPTQQGRASHEVVPKSQLFDSRQSSDWIANVVNGHNMYRAQYGAANVTWNSTLYPDTLRWANQCQFMHSHGNGYGENLAAGTGDGFGIADSLKLFMDEASKYDYNHPGFSEETGHFTQVVWKATKSVACAIAACGPGTIFSDASEYVVCRYSPPGNVIGQFAENVGRPV